MGNDEVDIDGPVNSVFWSLHNETSFITFHMAWLNNALVVGVDHLPLAIVVGEEQ